MAASRKLLATVWFFVRAFVALIYSVFEAIRLRLKPVHSPFLEGNFAPVDDEVEADGLQVIGQLPEALNGFFVRNGPNPKQQPRNGHYHWFDGDGMLHGVLLENGKATYRNRWVRTQRWQEEEAAGRELYVKLGAMVAPGAFAELLYWKARNWFSRNVLKKSLQGRGTANTSVVFANQRLLALVENDVPYEIDAPSLNTIGKYDFDGKYKGSFTAHPKLDERTGEMFVIGYDLSYNPPHIDYSVINANGELVGTCPISLPVNVMMHDMAITEHYAIIFDLPLAFRPQRTLLRQPALSFEADRPARFGIFPRDTLQDIDKVIRWFEAPACYIFHSINAWETSKEEIVLYACRSHAQSIGLHQELDATFPYPYEWRFNLATGVVNERRVCDLPCEFPRVRDTLIGYPAKYAYLGLFPEGGSPQDTPKMNGVAKWNLAEGRLEKLLRFGERKFAGECVFAPASDNQDEDDEDNGWLLTYVVDETTPTFNTEFWIIDAKQLEPLARVKLPRRVPYGFHGAWSSQIPQRRSQTAVESQ